MLIHAGVAVALGTNFNPWHTPSLNMQTAVSLACLRLGLTPAEALTAATVNAAHALNVSARVGSLELGKLADVLILNTADYRDVGYQLGTNLVDVVIKRGQVLYAQRA
jgi:imidazolonepropionase